jgi:hypothetical protein
MLRTLLLSILPVLLAPMAAQTIGVPGRNDLMVRMPPGLPAFAGSGATSCAFHAGTHSPTNAGSVTYRADAGSTATMAILFLSFCQPCGGANTINLGATVPAVCGGGNAGNCLAGPGNANLCWALSLAPGCWINVRLAQMGTIFWDLTIPIPAATAFPATLWAQALIVDPCSTQGWHMTPAIGIG